MAEMQNGDWPGYVAQVREQYIAGKLRLDRFEHDLGVAVLLDEGLLPDRDEIPDYLVARDGLRLVAPIVGA